MEENTSLVVVDPGNKISYSHDLNRVGLIFVLYD